jgi:uncharacterized membrane protein
VGIFFLFYKTRQLCKAQGANPGDGTSFSSISQTENMRTRVLIGCFFLLSCGTEPTATETAVTTQSTTNDSAKPAVALTAADTNSSFAMDSDDEALAVKPTKKPTGIYRFLLPVDGGQKILHTVAFYPGSYRLQEEYSGKRDSIVVTKGTWAPSQGFIWLYKDQILRGRYTWKGDTLQYYSPRTKKTFSMNKLTPVIADKLWQTKKDQGDVVYGVGNEPFWSIDLTDKDSLVLNMPNWTAPLRLKIGGVSAAKDSTVYTAASDSVKVVLYPLFCSDGMSNFLYSKKVKLVYRGQTLNGCGEELQ